MKKIILLPSLLLSCISLIQTNVSAQCPVSNTSSIVASPPATVGCGSTCTSLSVVSATTTLASTTTYSVTSIPYAPQSYTGGMAILVGLDDVWSGVVSMPFPFCFFGTKYSQCVIGANGQVCFNTSRAGAYDNWAINNASGLPSAPATAADVRNCILSPYYDIDPALGGRISYAVYGTAPCRTYVVSWSNVPLYDGSAYCRGQSGTEQAVMYESTNIIDINIEDREKCVGWNGGYGITGINNATGTAFFTAPGENGPAWAATNTSWRFTPNGTPTWTYTWYSSLSPLTVVGTGSPLTVCPTVTTKYYLKGVATSNCDSVVVWDSTLVTVGTGYVPNISNITSTNPTLCGACDGTIKLYGVAPGNTDTVLSTINGVAQPQFTATAGTDSILTFTGLCQGAYTYYVKVSCPSNTVSATLTQPPPIPASFTDVIHLGCNGDSVIFTNTTSPNTYHSYWNFGDGTAIDSTDVNPVHVFYDNPGYVGTYTVTLTYDPTHDPSCATQFTVVDSFNHPIDAHITSILPDTSVCWLTPVTFTGTTTSTLFPTYTWNFGDGTPGIPSASGTVNYSYPYPGDFTVDFIVTDNIGCNARDSAKIHVVSISVRTATHDTSICLSDSLFMEAFVNSQPANTPYTFMWSPAGNIGNTSTLTTNFFGLGDYLYTATATTGYPACTSHDTEAIHSYPPITLTNVTASQTIPWGSSIQLNADGAIYYTWVPNNGSLDNPNINDPVAVPIDTVTKYTVYGMSLFGCLDSASVIVSLGTMTEFVPSAFTPNGDGLNDVFRITNMTFQRLVDFRIYNRWGQQVFQTVNRETGWDGTFNGVPQDMGVYSYQIIIGLVDGTNKIFKGTVTLIR